MSGRHQHLLRRAALALLMGWGGACVVSPQPLPPIAPVIDATKLTIDDMHVLQGAPGAITGLAHITSLGITSSALDQGTVNADGSFSLQLTVDAASIYRLEAELDGERSLPVDIEQPTMAADGPDVLQREQAYAGCLTFSPDLVADRGDVKLGHTNAFGIQLQNGCTEDLSIDDIHLAFGGQGFSVTTTAPLTVPIGQVRAISLELQPSTAGSVEDVLVVHFGGSAPGFGVITLRGNGVP